MNPGDERAVSLLRSGQAVLKVHEPVLEAPLRPWQGREGELLARMAQGEPGLPREVVAAAAEACRIGKALELEAAAAKVKVPRTLQPLAPEIQRASARIQACGLESPFGDETLKAVPPGTLRAALDDARKGGLLGDGAAWTLRRDQMPELAEGLQKNFQKHLEVDREFPGHSGRGA